MNYCPYVASLQFSLRSPVNYGWNATNNSGTSLLISPTGLGKSDHNGEVVRLQGIICNVEYNLELSHGECNGEVFLLVR